MDYNLMFQTLKQFLINSGKDYDLKLITEAFEYATKMHEGQYRESGEEYICHPVAIAQICADMSFDTDCICAALLHDIIEDCPERTNLGEVKKRFGESVASLVDGLTKLEDMRFDAKTKEEKSVENFRKMLFAISNDPRVIFVKLCDRLHNMRTISAMTEEKQRFTARETMHIFAPMAQRLGMSKMKSELENISIQCLDPPAYNMIKNAIEKKFGASRDFIEKSQEKIKSRINMQNIRFTCEGRVKTIYSIYNKRLTKGKSLDEIYDFYAIRYIVNNLEEVYIVLGIIHELFKSIPGTFKDYISNPKPNGYQSIHTTVINENGIPLEVQIRTKEMHETAEFGMAAHWKYKSGEEAPEEITKKLMWLKSLVEVEKDINDPDDFLSLIKDGLYSDEIFVYTPKGDVKALPKGATIIDFAYAIHSAIGNKTVGGKINGIISPIDAELETGQIVEILTSNSSKGPNRNWLDFVKTGEARNKIRQWFKKERRAENILIGREEVERIFKQLNKSLTEERRDLILTNVSRREGFEILDDFYNAIGYGGVSPNKIVFKMREEAEKILKDSAGELILDIESVELAQEKPYSEGTVVVVDGLDNCQIKLAKCCNPLPGDEICAFMTKGGHGLSVHKASCPNYLGLGAIAENCDRLFSAFWNSEKIGKQTQGEKKNFKSMLKITAVNDLRLISAVTTLLADIKVLIHAINEVKTKSDGSITLNLLVSARDVEHLNYIIARLKTIKNITGANRYGG